MEMLLDDTVIEIEPLHDPVFARKEISVAVARLDKIHPVVSGNKIFKLHFFLKESIRLQHKPILTFGGAYSNHLLATAFACSANNIPSIGIVRTEEPEILSHTLKECLALRMKIHFIGREKYKQKDEADFLQSLKDAFGECIIIPEGGFSKKGASGAAHIMDKIAGHHATHICTAVGTATTVAGLLNNRKQDEKFIAVPVLKNLQDINERLSFLGCNDYANNLQVLDNYHFGGYAKKTMCLINFMNGFYLQHKIPTDFVYTAKMMFAVQDQINNNNFNPGSRILCLHTGGLQGNASLPSGMLVF